jgi:hypothetical protein
MFESFRLLLSWENADESEDYGSERCWYWEYMSTVMLGGDLGYTSDAFIQDEFDRIATLTPPFDSDCYEEDIAERWCVRFPSRCEVFGSVAPSLGLPTSIASIIRSLLQD